MRLLVPPEYPKPIFLRPEILQHPSLPRPLHGIAPRTIMGQSWWDEVRHKTYEINNQCCFACGVHRSQAEHRRWLEAHECYDIDYELGKATFKETVALCHSCHNFIHSQRLWSIFRKGQVSYHYIWSILDHGFQILDAADLKPYYKTIYVKNMLLGYSEETAMLIALGGKQVYEDEGDWSRWRLVFDGNEYTGRTKEEWIAEYGPML